MDYPKTGDTLSVNVDDVTTAIVGDAVVVKTSANLTTPNIGVANGDSLTVTGNVDGVSSNFSGVIVATGNVTGGNLVTAGSITDGTLTIDSGSITGGDAATFANTITGGTLTDGTLSINSGAITGATSGSFSTTLTATGNITGGNLTTGGQLNVTGNVTGGNLVTAGAITDGVFTADNGVFTGVVSIDASGNVDSGNVNTTLVDATTLTASGTVTGGTLTDGTLSSTSGTITGGVAATFSGAVSGGSITDGTATLSSGSITGGVAATFSGAVQGGSLTDGTATLSSGSITGGVAATFSGAVQGGSLTDGTATISSGAITGATSGSFSTTLTATGNITGGNLVTAGQLAADNIAATNGITAGTTIVATGNVSGGNVTTAGQVQADNVDATNGITAGTTVVATGNVSGGNLTTAGQIAGDNADITNGITAGTTITATGNVAGGNITTGGAVEATGLISSGSTITATGNVAGGNLTTAGQVAADNADITNGITAGTTITATGNVAGGNITTGGRVDATGAVTGASVTAGNVTINTDSIDSAGTAITLNTDSSDVDIVIENSAGNAYVKADAGTSTVVIGENGTQTTGATFKVQSTNSQMIPVGTTAQRPTGVTGMIRFNTTLDQFEFFDSNSWTTAGSDFTVIASETFSGDNSTTAFTLGSTQTTASCIVSINGVVQEPTTAYAVSGTTLTFTEAPLAGDTIEVREITTTSTLTGLASDDTSSSVTTEDGGDVSVKGNIIPSANVTYDLGSTTERWNDLYLAGNSIVLGSVVIKNTGGNAIGFFGADGTTPGVIDANVEIAGDSIQNGTSLVDFSGTNGDVQLTAGGTQSLTVISTGANVVGDFATTGDVRFLDSDNSNYVGFQAPATVSSNLVWTLPAADGTAGQALVTDASGVLSFAAAGATISSDTSTNTDFLLYFASTTTGALTAVKQDSGLTYNPSTGLLTSAAFSGSGASLTALNGSNISTGTVAAARVATLNQDTTGTAAIATTVTVADESSDTTCFPLFATAATGDLGAKSGSNLTFNSSTGVLAATTFSGSGASLTSLNGSNISTGTIAAARVATLNQNTTGTAGGLSSAVTVSLTGAVTGSATFTSAGDTASITTTATSDPTITLAGDLTGSATLTNLGDATLTATIAANSVALGTDTTGNYVATITGGTGIASSGATSGEGVAHTLSVDLSELTDMTGGMTGTDEFIVLDAGADRRKAANEIGLSIFNNDSGFTTNTGDITNVSVSGTGLSGGGASGSVTITSNATSANTASTIVARDGSGNFSAGVITATATQARYADLAEMYAADGDIEAGTVVHFAGEGKLAACNEANHHAVAGIVSTDPAYLMNTDQEGVALAISGRVPCKVTGVVNAGDLMVSAGNGRAMANNSPAIGTVIGKAIESNAGGEAVIEVLAMMM